MSSEIAGLGVSLHSPARAKAVPDRENCSPSFLFRFCVPILILLAAAGGSAPALSAPTAAVGESGMFEATSVVLNIRLFAAYIGMFTLFLIPILGWRAFQLWNQKRQRERFLHVPLAQASALSSARDEERKRLSRELHDTVGPILTAVGLQLRAIRLKSLSTEQLHARLDEACRLNGEALQLVRDLARGLRPGLSEHLSLAAALELRARHCVLEALTNCAKLANPSSIRIQVRSHGDLVNVIVEDDGIGFDHRDLGSGLGLLGMRERVAGVNGRMSIVARQQGGTALCLEIPVVRGAMV